MACDSERVQLECFCDHHTGKIFLSASSVLGFFKKLQNDEAYEAIKLMVENYQNHVDGIGLESGMDIQEL